MEQPLLLVLGDSPASHPEAWPQLLADRAGLATLSVAREGARSSELHAQCGEVLKLLSQRGRGLTAHCWALVHVGAHELSAVSAGAARCCGGASLAPALPGLMENVQALASRLCGELRLRNLILCGAMFTTAVPAMARTFATRRLKALNATYLTALRGVQLRADWAYPTVDASVGEVPTTSSSRAPACQVMSGRGVTGGEPLEAGQVVVIDVAALIESVRHSLSREAFTALWESPADSLALSEHGHQVLSTMMHKQFEKQRRQQIAVSTGAANGVSGDTAAAAATVMTIELDQRL